MIVQHPENVGQGPQVFDTFTVHTCSLSKVVLGEKHLVSGAYVNMNISLVVIMTAINPPPSVF